MKKFGLQDHKLVPKHNLLSPPEVEEVLKKYDVEPAQLPKIHVTDPVIKEIGGEVGDIVEIIRDSPTAKIAISYRLVID
jgi:DNA-directed RNA polymerase subunit H